jgi:hypothetical protein
LLATQGGSSQFTKLEFSPNEREWKASPCFFGPHGNILRTKTILGPDEVKNNSKIIQWKLHHRQTIRGGGATLFLQIDEQAHISQSSQITLFCMGFGVLYS